MLPARGRNGALQAAERQTLRPDPNLCRSHLGKVLAVDRVLDARGHPQGTQARPRVQRGYHRLRARHRRAAGARIALHNEDLLRSGCIKVDFCAGHEHDVTMDDELDEGDFDGSYDMGSGDEMDF